MSNNIDSLNYLGTFDVMDEVYVVYPSGGVPGNFVIVSGQVLYWNEAAMRWLPSGGGTADNFTVNGRLTADEAVLKDGFRTSDFRDDTQGSALRKVDGQWTLSVDKVNVRNGNSIKGQSTVTSFVFCRRNSKPPTPLNGDFYNPQPDGTIWKDGVPAGTEPIWMSSRIFTSDGNAPQQAGWKDPVLLRDDKDHDIEFSPWPTTSVPEAPNDTNTQGGSGIQIWFDPDNHTGSTWPQMNWMAIATKYINSEGNTVYGPWTISLIKGERGADGDTYEHVFYRTELPIQPLVFVNQNQYQRDDYLPVVANVSACLGESNTFTDDPKGVNEQYKYEWFLTRHKTNGTWKSYANGGRPALWATYSKNHDITIGSNGHWFIDGEDTGKVAVGKDGAVATVKGRVDVYYQADAETGQTSLQTYPASLQGDDALETGDCWVVLSGENGDSEDVSGHLFLYIGGGNQNWEDDWQDLGEFKGEKGDPGDNGHSQYLYLAWASDVQFNEGSPQTFKSVTDFTADPAVGQNYGWLGIKVSETAIANMDSSTNAYLYKWNYLAGRDGMDYEHIYIRTSVNTPPEINANVVSDPDYQDPEFLPEVDNMTDYVYSQGFSGNTIESNEFTDDPGGISERWPYEWQARRDKVDGEWQMFTQPVLHRNWAKGEKGEDGAGQAYITTSLDQIVVDCGADGKPLSSSQRQFSILAQLKWGDEVCDNLDEQQDSSVSSNRGTCSSDIDGKNCNITISFSTSTALTSGRILIVLAGIDENDVVHTATKTIPILAIKQGANGNTGPALRFRGEWSDREYYTYDGNIRDCVKYNGNFYILYDYTIAEQTGDPVNDQSWEYLGNVPFVATELLLAENGAINLLSSNVINLFNGAVKTTSINADGNGSYVIYYNVSPYGKRMEFCYDGWIYYYNNDAENTIAWKLGHGGQIIQNVIESWDIIRLHYFGSSASSVPMPTSSASWNAPTEFYQYSASSNSQYSQYNECVFKYHSSSNPAPNPSAFADDGWYTPDSGVRNMNNGDDTPVYVFMLYKIVNGKIVSRQEVTSQR